MEKAYDYIVADYAGNKVKVNGEEYKVGACCVDLLNSFNGPEEEKEFEELSRRIYGYSTELEADAIPQESLDALGADIISLLRQVKTVHPFTAFATDVQLAAINGAFSAGSVIGFRRLYNECCVISASTGMTPYDILRENRPDLDANLFFNMAANSHRLYENLTVLYGELYQDFMYSKRKIGALADRFGALPKADAEHMMPIAFETLPKVATQTKTQFVKAEFSGRNKSQLANRLYFSRYIDFIFYDFYHGLGFGHYPRKCEICGKYYLKTDSRPQRYCSGLSGIEGRNHRVLTCRAVGKRRGEKERAANDPILIVYKRVYDSIRKDKSRGKISAETEAFAKQAAEDCRDKAIQSTAYANGAYVTDMNKDRFYAAAPSGGFGSA